MSEPTLTEPRRIDRQTRIAVPPEVMKVLGAKQGDYVVYEIRDGEIRLRRVEWTPV